MSTNYIKRDGTGYPVDEFTIRSENENVSFPRPIPADIAAEFGYDEVQPTPRPVVAEGHVIEAAPEKVDGVWYQRWTVIPLSQAEKDAKVNAARQARLDEGIEYTFPNGEVDRIQVGDRDLILFMEIRMKAQQRQGDETAYQIFRTKTNRVHFLTAAQVLHLTESVSDAINQIYIESWQEKD